jgi:hypothetical protein
MTKVLRPLGANRDGLKILRGNQPRGQLIARAVSGGTHMKSMPLVLIWSLDPPPARSTIGTPPAGSPRKGREGGPSTCSAMALSTSSVAVTCPWVQGQATKSIAQLKIMARQT